MITNDHRTLLVLNDLMLAARDAEKGFETAADQAHEPTLVELFASYALQRGRFAAELEQRIRTLRGKPAKVPNPAAALHRAWMEAKAETDANESHALLAECERGEDLAVKAYRMALQERDLDEQSRGIIQRQYEFVQAAHDRIRQLRDSVGQMVVVSGKR